MDHDIFDSLEIIIRQLGGVLIARCQQVPQVQPLVGWAVRPERGRQGVRFLQYGAGYGCFSDIGASSGMFHG